MHCCLVSNSSECHGPPTSCKQIMSNLVERHDRPNAAHKPFPGTAISPEDSEYLQYILGCGPLALRPLGWLKQGSRQNGGQHSTRSSHLDSGVFPVLAKHISSARIESGSRECIAHVCIDGSTMSTRGPRAHRNVAAVLASPAYATHDSQAASAEPFCCSCLPDLGISDDYVPGGLPHESVVARTRSVCE